MDMRLFDGNLLQSFQRCNAWMQCAELKVMKKDVVFQRSLVNHQMGHPQNSYVSLLQGILKYGNNMKKQCSWCGTKWTNARIQVVYIPVICSFRFCDCVVYCLATQRKNKWTPGKYPKDHVESIPSWKHWSASRGAGTMGLNRQKQSTIESKERAGKPIHLKTADFHQMLQLQVKYAPFQCLGFFAWLLWLVFSIVPSLFVHVESFHVLADEISIVWGCMRLFVREHFMSRYL